MQSGPQCWTNLGELCTQENVKLVICSCTLSDYTNRSDSFSTQFLFMVKQNTGLKQNGAEAFFSLRKNNNKQPQQLSFVNRTAADSTKQCYP